MVDVHAFKLTEIALGMLFIAEAVADALASCTTLTLFFIRRKTLLPLPAEQRR